MKKNKMLRMASALLVMVLLTTCMIGGTFAKYVTTGTGSDTARVAKWGVKVESTGNAFAKEYATTDTAVSGTIAKSVVTATGAGADNAKLVAPGTSGNLLDSSITGTPEVAVKVETTATLTLTGWTIKVDNGTGTEVDKEYCPIIITIDGTEYKMGATTDETNHVYATIAAFQTAVNTALSKTKNVAANTNLETDYDHNVAWKWDFAGDANTYQTDAEDTALGNLETAPTIAFTYTATVTQID